MTLSKRMTIKEANKIASKVISHGSYAPNVNTSERYIYCPHCNLKISSWKGSEGLKTSLSMHLQYDFCV